jgi:hypothetical protein
LAGSSPPSRAPDPARQAPPAWKSLLALLSLALSLLLWMGGLLESLQRPSVADALSLRQLELGVLAAEVMPESMRPALVGADPRGELADALGQRMEASETPAPVVERLTLTLLEGSTDANVGTEASRMRQLREMVAADRRPLLTALIEAQPLAAETRRQLLVPWEADRLLEQLVCERLAPSGSACPAERDRNGLLLRLLGVSVIPALLVLLGGVLLLREGWRQWRRRAPPAPPLQGPPLDLVDVTLLIAGAFVVLGEVLVPAVAQPLLRPLLERLELGGEAASGVLVLCLYLLLMLAPLLLLRLLLRRRSAPPVGGWLQWFWRPPAEALRQALHGLLLVLPLVALSGWLIERFWSDAGGSNPLLEMVLTGRDPLALLSLALTALVLAPLFEETLFRGVLLPVVGRRCGGPAAVVASAAIFAVAHLSLSELAPLFVLGLGLGWLRWRSGRLASCALMHGLWNGMTFANLLLLGL